MRENLVLRKGTKTFEETRMFIHGCLFLGPQSPVRYSQKAFIAFAFSPREMDMGVALRNEPTSGRRRTNRGARTCASMRPKDVGLRRGSRDDCASQLTVAALKPHAGVAQYDWRRDGMMRFGDFQLELHRFACSDNDYKCRDTANLSFGRLLKHAIVASLDKYTAT